MFFEHSRADRARRARVGRPPRTVAELMNSPIPPPKAYELFTPQELFNGGDRTLVFDAESYPNYFELGFKCIDSGKVIYFEDTPVAEMNLDLLGWILHRFRIVGFYSRVYDLPITGCALQGVRAPHLFRITQEIIRGDMRAYEVERKYGTKTLHVNHIDIEEVAPISASLKIYAGRLHCKRMQDLPFPPDTELTYDQACIVRDYNINDLDNTELLYREVEPHIKLREELGQQYRIDLRSKSDAQVSEAIIGSELEKLGVKFVDAEYEVGSTFKYVPPPFVEFKTPQFQNVLNIIATTDFVIGNGGSADCPEPIKRALPTLGGVTYRFGIGGLHSSEESISHYATDEVLLIDRDVASYYPNIILNLGLFPENLGPKFLEVYRKIVTARLKAKHDHKLTGEESFKVAQEALKIVINGGFGKLGNFYSKLYAPDLLTTVTMTGQLCLAMLAEMIELAGFEVVSVNTDGIVTKVPKARYKDFETQCIAWEEKTGFLTEETRYKSLHCRDVNNYIAVLAEPDKGKLVKLKGVYSNVGSALNSPLSKNPESYICSMAVQAFLARGVPIAETVMAHGFVDGVIDKHYPSAISRFVNVRNVTGGAEKDDVYLGKAIRWYYAKGETGTIHYVKTGNIVPKSEGAKPLMDLPDTLPADLDYGHYIEEANEILYDLGVYKREEQAKLF